MKDGETKATGNPFYGGATPEEVVRALLQKPKATKDKLEPKKAKPARGDRGGG